MKLRHILPVILFCFIFLLYSIYFVKVVNQGGRLESNSFAKTIKKSWYVKKPEIKQPLPVKIPKSVITETKILPLPEPPKPIVVPETKYVNFTWLNIRKEPSLVSPIIEKIYENDAVIVLSPSKSGWTEIQIVSGIKGFVASRYLSDAKKPEPAPKPEPASVTQTDVFKIPIITYHHVTDEKKYAPELSLPVVNFLAQLEFLAKNNYKTYTFSDLKNKPSVKGVILTFDDGYSDQYQVAQHLNGKGMKGVFFIITDRVGTAGYLDWRQLQKMRDWGMEIGSHGVKSADLPSSTDFYVKDELERSKKTLEEKLNISINAFSYPAGRYDSRIIKAVESAGYSFARTIDGGSQYTSKSFLKLPTLRVFSPAGAKQFDVWLE